MLAAEYNFTIHYSVKLTPYQISELSSAAERRKYRDTILNFNLHANAANGTEASIDKFFNTIKPKSNDRSNTLGDPFAESF